MCVCLGGAVVRKKLTGLFLFPPAAGNGMPKGIHLKGIKSLMVFFVLGPVCSYCLRVCEMGSSLEGGAGTSVVSLDLPSPVSV